jgi:hypothetical protein
MKKARSLWHEKLSNLIKQLREQGIKTKFVPDAKTRDYLGMNPEAAKAMGYRMPAKTFYVDRNMSAKDKYETLKHEYDEYLDMKDKGYPYWKSHVRALDNECEE